VWYNGKKKRPGCIRSPGIYLTTFYENGLRLNRIALSKKSDSAEHPSQTAYVLHYIQKRGKVIIRSIVAVDTVIYRKKTDIFLWKQNFRIKADLQIVSPQSAHILNDNRCDISCFYFFNQLLKTRAIEIHTRKTIVSKMANIREPISASIIFQVFLLRWDLSRIFSANNMQCC